MDNFRLRITKKITTNFLRKMGYKKKIWEKIIYNLIFICFFKLSFNIILLKQYILFFLLFFTLLSIILYYLNIEIYSR